MSYRIENRRPKGLKSLDLKITLKRDPSLTFRMTISRIISKLGQQLYYYLNFRDNIAIVQINFFLRRCHPDKAQRRKDLELGLCNRHCKMFDFCPCGRRPLVHFVQHDKLYFGQQLYYCLNFRNTTIWHYGFHTGNTFLNIYI